MQNSILKWWNVHYMTPEELEEEQEKDHDPSVTGTGHQSDSKQNKQAANGPEANMQSETENAVMDAEEDFNSTTGSYSGGYGKDGADPEYEDQIASILMEKDDALRSLIEHAEEESKEQ